MIINAEVRPFPDEPIEKTLKRLRRKCKNEDIAREVFDHLYFRTKREKKRDKQKRNIK